MASKYGGYMGKVLKIDLTTRETSEYPWSDEERALYLGGKIMAARILYDNITERIEPLAPENILVVSTGPLTGTGAPSSSRFNVSTLSPLTGYLASSNCGGTFGLHLKRAGYDALVITGKSETPLWVEIEDDAIRFNDAAHLWGMTTGETQEALGGKRGKLVIGPAGEHLVRFAAIFSDERTAGRAGVGAVMGSKNLKAVTATGTCKVPLHNEAAVKKSNKAWVNMLLKHPITGRELPAYGSGYFLRGMQKHKMLATHNFSRGQFDDYDSISGHTLAEKYLIKNIGCVTCPIKCSRQVEVNGKKVKGPELETLALLGPNLENNDLQQILNWNFQLDELGMDTITTGGVIGFAMELNEKGLWDSGLEFGKIDNLPQVFDDIAHRRGIGDDLAEGTKRLAQKYGGVDFAINAKGLELAAYEPRGAVGHGLGYATANRGGCHLNAGYLVLMEGLVYEMDPYTHRAKAALAIMNQNLLEAISAGGNCLFPVMSFFPGWFINHPRNIVTRITNWILAYSGPVVNLLNTLPAKALGINLPTLPHPKALTVATGMKIRLGEFRDIGERGFNLERMFNMRIGLTGQDDALPKRLTDEDQVPGDPRTKVPLERMKRDYYKIRRWSQDGTPQDAKKRQLSLL